MKTTVQTADAAVGGKCVCGTTGYYASATDTECTALPTNSDATATTKIGYVCKTGFVDTGIACIACAAANGDYVCKCSTGFEGSDCSTKSGSSTSNGFMFSMLSIFVGFFLTL